MKWRKIIYQNRQYVKGEITGELPESGEKIILYNKPEDEVMLGYLWRGNNPRDHNPEGKFFFWCPVDELYSPVYWNPTHWMPWPQRPEEVEK